MTGRTLNPLDTSWLILDSEDTPMHVGALMIFSAPDGAAASFTAQLAEALRAHAPAGAPWNLKLSRGPRLTSRWIEETEADLEYHFRESALPDPGGERELGMLVERLHSRALDLSLPPWEIHLIENLERGRFAIYCKLHQSLMDHVSLLQLLTGALTAGRGSDPVPFWAIVSQDSARSRSFDAAAEALRGLSRDSLTSLRQLGRAFARLYRADDALRAPYTAPRSALNAHIGRERRFATQQYSIERLEKIAAATSSSVEELCLFLCGSVLRRFFKEHNALPEESLLALQLVPGAQAESALAFIALGTEHADPRERLAEVQASVRASREHLSDLPEALVPAYTLTTALPYLAGQALGVGRLMPAMFNLIVAGMRGPAEPMHLGAAKLDAVYPMLPLTQNCALAIGALRYADTLNIGISGARETLPRLQRMAVYMGLALDDLEQRVAAGDFNE